VVCNSKKNKFVGLMIILTLCMAVLSCYGQIKYRRAIDDPLGQQRSFVYDIFGEFVIRGPKIHQPSLRKILNTGVKKITGINNSAQAWQSILHKDDVIGIKFCPEGGRHLATNTEVCAVLLRILYSLDFKPEQIMVIGLEKMPEEAQGTMPWKYGWQSEPVYLGSEKEYLATWLSQVTAIIHIPSAMDDNITGIRGAIADMAYSAVKHPGKYYLSHGDPFVAEIYQLPEIRGKIRLTIVNNLRSLFYGGPDVKQQFVSENGTLLFSNDPVSLDRITVELLSRQRKENDLPADTPVFLEAQHLITAEALDLGYQDLNMIEYRWLNHDKDE
ncbi:MAG: hypothetical protein JXM68_05140, partial [Sedimentisphaerales bacterium]|nr:hypothetical protein [Sedimentisphaerales bacterium]